MILLVDNYDSFTYNLVQLLSEFDEVTTVRSDRLTVDDIRRLGPDRIVLSPGPGGPRSAGVAIACVRAFCGEIPLLGVCLGHQAIAAALGAAVVRAPLPCHGKVSAIRHEGRGIFRGLPSPFAAVRYHSLVVEEASLPPSLQVTARTEEGLVMALEHVEAPLFGVQFHPESIMTAQGRRLLENFTAL